MLFTIEGAGEIFLECDDRSDRREAVPSRTVLSVPAGLRYAYRPIEVPWKVAWFHLETGPRQGGAVERDFTIRPCPTAYRVGATMRELIEESLEASVAGDFSGENEATKRIEELYANILLARLQSETSARKPSIPDRSQSAIDSLWNRVAFALDEKWTSSRLAEASGFSPTHLNRLCRELLGLSTMRQLNALRMERARELIRSTDYPVHQVAGLVGYEDPFAFSTAFKREFGMSPRDCRKGNPA
jgi:AraC-like DNA-binding protein